MSLGLKSLIRQHLALSLRLRVMLGVMLWAAPVVAQNASNPVTSALKYDHQTEIKTKGVIEEVNLLTVGSRKDFTELVVKSGEEKLHIYVCPKPFQEEMGISFNKGDQIAVTGSKVKQDSSEVILARELVVGPDTLLFRDDKGKPVWDERTGK